ncbi:TPA: hydroxymethylglutaryl-CoA synthase [Candidatus Dependentiae bacterium]|nr:MAG: hypothetical protein UR14_C0003G0084 [candidate division TM6 bacterium GW2011_GWE2_31_21]KKP53752.1 MAG: hypothetical protein UR43_C0003G0073 [candidate division TM6 bacterium GW2011_GWF2_33_332]HBS48494.1 hydroxymethylglutaryl-CoA synthase [Candidatus Dependentiae bacterium]HBZ73109.1 hydroxymethylglutaryl-CoA synthase [Candidatus Dependentiae bacterium]
MPVGIVGFGVYLPKFRIKVEEIAAYYKQDPNKIKSSLLINEKSVAAKDEDSATMSVQSSQQALIMAEIDKSKIGSVYVGSESHPYAVKPTATIVGNALNLTNFYTAADFQFACKSTTAAVYASLGLVASKYVEYALVIGADKAQSKNGDILEYCAGAGSVTWILGSNENEIVASIDKIVSFSTNTPDFWRRHGEDHPEYLGRFTGEPSYFFHITQTVDKILQDAKMVPADFDHVVFHQPNGAFPYSIAKKLGFVKKQIELGLVAPHFGNCYSATTMIGVSAVLDQAKENQKILVVSYGSGSGCDAMILTTTSNLSKKQNKSKTVQNFIDQKEYIDYSTILKWN